MSLKVDNTVVEAIQFNTNERFRPICQKTLSWLYPYMSEDPNMQRKSTKPYGVEDCLGVRFLLHNHGLLLYSLKTFSISSKPRSFTISRGLLFT